MGSGYRSCGGLLLWLGLGVGCVICLEYSIPIVPHALTREPNRGWGWGASSSARAPHCAAWRRHVRQSTRKLRFLPRFLPLSTRMIWDPVYRVMTRTFSAQSLTLPCTVGICAFPIQMYSRCYGIAHCTQAPLSTSPVSYSPILLECDFTRKIAKTHLRSARILIRG